MLTARDDGTKCKPFVLLRRKRPDKKIVEKYGKKLHLVWAGRTWMDDELTSLYLDAIIGPQLFAKRLLVWDAFKCHLSESTKLKMKELNLHSAIIPGGCTKFVQVSEINSNVYWLLWSVL